MLESTEIRWFFKGNISSNVSKILAETSPDVYESRTDYYLFVQGCDNVGIKIRNSRLEIKWRRDVQPYDVDKLRILVAISNDGKDGNGLIKQHQSRSNN